MIWWLLEWSNKLLSSLSPVIFVLTSIFWLYRDRRFLSYLALLGSILACASKASHILVKEVSSFVGVHGVMPNTDQSVLTWLIYLYGFNFGVFIFGVAVGVYFFKAVRV